MIGGMMNVLNGATLFWKITDASNIFMIHMHRDSLGRFVLVDFDEGTISLSDLGIIFGSCYYV